MCYVTVVSTTSDRDLSEFNTALVRFERRPAGSPEVEFLGYKNKWHLGSREGCSCGFRHLDRENADLGFSQPVDWWPEAKEDVEATLQAVGIFRTILEDGSKLDCVDAWEQDRKSVLKLHGELAVDLASLPAIEFRFLEGQRFDFTGET